MCICLPIHAFFQVYILTHLHTYTYTYIHSFIHSFIPLYLYVRFKVWLRKAINPDHETLKP